MNRVTIELHATSSGVQLAWDYPDVNGVTFNVYRSSGPCPQPFTATDRVATGLTHKSFSAEIRPGAYCFAVTAVVGGVESNDSNSVTFVLPLPGTSP
jgi:hypothetical protein